MTGSNMDFVVAVVLGLVCINGVSAMMDYRHFAAYDVPSAGWTAPGWGPPSFILALDENKPPYNSSAAMEPHPGCRAKYATVCAIQHSIRLVTRARLEACPLIEAGGDTREAALANITAGNIYTPFTDGFGVFVVDDSATILADALQPGLVGQRLDGLLASGLVAQAQLMDYIRWVTSWGGGFVPHYTTRISKTALNVAAGEAPLEASAYFERCKTGEYIGVAFGREPLPVVENCLPRTNGFCTSQNMRRIIGLALTDVLNMHNAHELSRYYYKTNFGEKYAAVDSYLFDALSSWWGYPGDDPYRNPNSFPENYGTMWALGDGYAKYGAGWNGSFWMSGTVDGEGGPLSTGNYVSMVANRGALLGGTWQDWMSGVNVGLRQITFTVGYVWNGVGFAVGSVTDHSPANALQGPRCETCLFDRSWPCAPETVLRLAGHTFMDFSTPGGSWAKVSSNSWFGSIWDNVTHLDLQGKSSEGTWPSGLFSLAFDWQGICVSSTRSPDEIGKTVAELHNDDDLHSRCTTAAQSGGAWIEHVDINGVPRLSYVTMLSKSGSVYYMLVGYSKVTVMEESPLCSSAYSEPCSETRAQVLVGAAIAEILPAEDESDLQLRVTQITNRTGEFSPAQVGDFQVYVLSSAAACPSYAAKCPSLDSTWITDLIEAGSEDISWVSLPATTSTEASEVYVRRIEWSSPTTTDTLELLVLVMLGTDVGPPMCNFTSDCPSSSKCSSSGRCVCDTGFTANYTTDTLPCDSAQYASVSLQCADVRNLKCDGLVCSECPGGYYCPYGTALPCAAGFVCPAGPTMSLCPAGTIGIESLATSYDSCQACGAGTYAGSSGQTVCVECPAGTAGNGTGESECEPCSVGTYQETTGGTSCVACPSGFTTTLRGATTESECVCPSGTYQPTSAKTCLACPEGMACSSANTTEAAMPMISSTRRLAEGDSYPYPLVLEGYMTVLGSELTPYKCKEPEWCPGGDPGSCANNRDITVVSCAKCEAGTHSTDDGSCVACNSVAAPFIMFGGLALGFICLAIFAYLINTSQLNQSNSMTAIIISLGLVVSSIQTLAMFSNLDVKWMSPVKEMLQAMSLLTFDLELLQVECFVGINSVWNLLVRQLIVPFAAVYIVVIVIGRKVFRDPGLEVVNESINAIGGLFQLFFVSILISCLSPFLCYKHPANMGHSMVSDPAVLCSFTGDHLSMALVCIFVYIFVILPYLAITTFATVQYRKSMGDALASYRHLRRFKFLFYRYNPSRYWFGICVIFRGLLVCLVPVVFRDYAAVQVLTVSIILLTFTATQLYSQPWRGTTANLLDASIVIFLVLLLICVAMTTNFDDTETVVGIFAGFAFGAVFASALVIISVEVIRRLLPNPWFDFFICHHKAAAAAQARHLQILFMKRSGRHCFLDSDHLTNLQELFEIVRTRCGRLIVYLTAETLRRPWCAGEITIAWKVHKRVIAVRHPSMIMPADKDIEASQLNTYLSSAEFKLIEYGVTNDLVASAYRWLLHELQDVVCVAENSVAAGRRRFDIIVDRCLTLHNRTGVERVSLSDIENGGILIDSKSTSSKSTKSVATPFRSDMVIVSSLPNDDESLASIGILVRKIQSAVVEKVPEGLLVLSDYGGDIIQEASHWLSTAHMLIVVLAGGSLQSLEQLQAIVTAMGSDIPCVPVSLPNFRFPVSQFFQEELPSRFGVEVPEVELRLQQFFKTISIAFTTFASEQVLNVQAEALAHRIPKRGARQGANHLPKGKVIDLAQLEEAQRAPSHWLSQQQQQQQPSPRNTSKEIEGNDTAVRAAI